MSVFNPSKMAENMSKQLCKKKTFVTLAFINIANVPLKLCKNFECYVHLVCTRMQVINNFNAKNISYF